MSIGPVYRSLLEIAKERGVDTKRILAEIGFDEESVLAPEARLVPEVGRALAATLVRETGDPELGLCAAERFQIADLDLLGYVLWHASSLGALFDTIAQYARLLGDTAECGVEREAGQLVVTLGRSGGRVLLPEASDYFVGAVTRLVHEWSGGAAQLVSVALPRGKPRRPARYQRFFGCPVTFGASAGCVVYRDEPVAAARPEHDPKLGRVLRRQADLALAALPVDASLVERARALLGHKLDRGDPRLADVASELGTSERTLRRRLAEAGTGYRTLIDEVRRERALMLAHEGVHSVTAIAVQVGFADMTAFTRAFRRWTGSLPSDYLVEAKARTKRAPG